MKGITVEEVLDEMRHLSSRTANGPAGAFDQRKIEERPDVLVYTTASFTEATQASGPVTPTIYVTSDAKDTDISVSRPAMTLFLCDSAT